MKSFGILLIIAVFITGCSDIADDIPECINDLIEQEKKEGCADGMDEYLFNGQLVYVFTQAEPICSDFGSPVYDEQCTQLCFIGGIAGLTICQDVNFNQNATFKRTIWEK